MNSSIKPYNEHDNKTSQLISLFNKISFHYDTFNNWISLGMAHAWRKRSIHLLQDFSPQRILDVATGTADMAIKLSKMIHPIQIVGIDISAKMLAVGEDKIKQKNLSDKIKLELQDVSSLSFNNNCFDAVTVVFGIRNIEKLSISLQEMNRVLVPNGLLLIVEVNQPEKKILQLLYKIYIKLNFSRAKKLLGNKDYQYLINSMSYFPRGTKLIEIVTKQNFELVQYKHYTLDVCSVYLFKKMN